MSLPKFVPISDLEKANKKLAVQLRFIEKIEDQTFFSLEFESIKIGYKNGFVRYETQSDKEQCVVILFFDDKVVELDVHEDGAVQEVPLLTQEYFEAFHEVSLDELQALNDGLYFKKLPNHFKKYSDDCIFLACSF